MNRSGQAKAFLNRQANSWLRRLGYSEARARDAKREAWWWLQTRAHAVRRRRRLFRGRSLVWTAPGRVELVAVDVPHPAAGEVTVQLSTTVVSPGTERAQYLRLPNTDVGYPHRTGYSGAGIVAAVGRGVSHFQPGDAVAVANANHASLVTVAARSVYPIPSGVSLEDGAFVQLGVICAQGVLRAAFEQGERVCVIGAGLIGVLAQRIAAATGAGETVLIAASRAKERVAGAGGARFLALETDRAEIGLLAEPVVIEATGDPAAIDLAVDVAAEGGRIVLLGSPRGATSLPVDLIRAKRLRLVGAHVGTLTLGTEATDAYAREASTFLDLLASRRVVVSDLVDEIVDPHEAELFYRRLARRKTIVGARFDWTALREQAGLPARLLSPPRLRGRGADPDHPLLLGQPSSDPFAGAVGHLRIGLVGCGDVSGQSGVAMQLAPNVELVASYDPVVALADETAALYGGDVERSFEALLDRADVDAVLLSVPHHLHLPLGRTAAAAGKHLIVEKPLANNLESAERLAKAAEEAGVVLSVCFPQRFEPIALEARRLISAGALGEIRGVLLTFWMDKPPSYWVGGYSGRSPSNWRESRQQAGGGVLVMNLSHYVDLIRYLTGLEAELVFARAEPDDAVSEVEDAVSVSIHYAGGAVGTLCASTALRGATAASELRIWGTQGQILTEPRALVYTLSALAGVATGRWHSLGSDATTNARAVYLSRLATAIARGEPCDVGAEDGIAVQALIEAAYRSADTGRSIVPTELFTGVGA